MQQQKPDTARKFKGRRLTGSLARHHGDLKVLCSLQGHRIPCDLFFKTLKPRQKGRRFADDTFKSIFLNENFRISIKISPKVVPEGPINNIPALVQIMAWRRPGNTPLSGSMIVRLPMHICVIRHK